MTPNNNDIVNNRAATLCMLFFIFLSVALTLLVSWLPLAFHHVEIPHTFWADGIFGWAWIPFFFGLSSAARFGELRARHGSWKVSWFAAALLVLTIICVGGLFTEG